jgi:hypothetical protein
MAIIRASAPGQRPASTITFQWKGERKPDILAYWAADAPIFLMSRSSYRRLRPGQRLAIAAGMIPAAITRP